MTDSAAPAAGSPEAFIAHSRAFLCDEYPAKLKLALEQLAPDDLWWKPGPQSNSIGNLLLHLAGNVRQWVVSGIGGAQDVRTRSAEFAAEGGQSLDQVWAVLQSSLDDARDVLNRLDGETLGRTLQIQGLQVECMRALYHVVEHFSMHTGQILWIIKARSGADLNFYRVDDQGMVIGTQW